MRFGVTLRIDLFTEKPTEASRVLLDTFGGKENLFFYLKEHVDVVEISTIGSKSDPHTFMEAVCFCAKYDLGVTIHGLLKENEPAKDFFTPYLPLFQEKLQESYLITLHPLKQKVDTIKALRELCSYAEEQKYPVTFALENQRLTQDYSVNGICKSVGEIVAHVDSNRVHTCFDFGHHLSNKRKQGETADPFDQAFADRIRHTHIHSMCEGTTHFPLYSGETELDQNLKMLIEKDYSGVLLLELDFQRFVGKLDLKEALCRSVRILKNAYEQTVRKQSESERYQKQYSKILADGLKKLNELDRSVMLLSPSSYLLKFGEIKIAVDPSLLDIPVSPEGREKFLEILRGCDGVIYTHKHGDHYDAAIARDISNDAMTWFVPDFFSENDICGGKLTEKNCIFVKANQCCSFGKTEIKFFESCHSSNDSFVPEYGFAILYEGKHYVFPVDVRNYDTGLVKPFPDTEVLFAHLWLGREKALEIDEEYIRQFADFVNAYGAKRVCLGHLFDVRREISDMWTDLHYRYLESRIETIVPLRQGDVIAL